MLETYPVRVVVGLVVLANPARREFVLVVRHSGGCKVKRQA